MSPSPDLSPYVDLSLDDRDPQELVELGVSVIKSRLPDWTPREGNTEVVLIEAMATEVAEAIYAINRLPSQVMEGYFAILGVTRDPGAPPTVSVKFNMTTTFGYSIPAGTAVRLALGGDDYVVFTTNVQLNIANGVNNGSVVATSATYTDDANGTPLGTVLELLDSIIYVDSVVTDSVVTGGRDPESDEEFFDRAVQRVSRLSETLVLPSHFVAAALEYPAVERAKALDNYTPANDPDNNGPVGNDPGYITIGVYGSGTAVDNPTKTAMDLDFEARCLANLNVSIVDPTINTEPVTTAVIMDAGYLAADVIINVTKAIQDYLSWATWDWSTVLRRNELMRVIGNAEGVAYVNTLTVPAADRNLTGVLPLVNAGAISVTAT